MQNRVTSWNFKLQKPAVAQNLGNRVVRLANACEQLPQIGWILICNGTLSKNRLSPAIHISDTENLVVENVTVHHAAGMAFVAERVKNVTMNKYCVLLPPNSERMVTSTADATHFVSCSGKIILENCIFENMLDDGTNVHGIYAEVREKVDSYTLGMTRGHSQQQGIEFVRPGEEVVLSSQKGLKPIGEKRKVVSVKNINDYYFEVTFAEKLEDNILSEEVVAENVTLQPDVDLRNCEIRRNRARSILISTAGKVLVEKNRFIKCAHAGILGAGDANYWFESGPVKKFIIRNNLIEDQGLCSGNAAVLIMQPEVGQAPDSLWHYHRNIIMENNTINTFSRTLVQAKSVENLVFRNNTINKSMNYPAANAYNPVFILTNCKDVTIEDNRYNWGEKATIQIHKTGVNIQSANNENIENKKWK